MSNRIIDLTLSSAIVGTESIPGTEQVSSGETTPKNRRYTWNMVLAWIVSSLGGGVVSNTITIDEVQTTGRVSIPEGTSVTGVVMCYDNPTEENIYPISVRVGTTDGADNILPDTEVPLGSYTGIRVSLSHFIRAEHTLYITVSAYPGTLEFNCLVTVSFETTKVM